MAGVPSLLQQSLHPLVSQLPGHAAAHPELRRSVGSRRPSHAPQAGRPCAPRAPAAGAPLSHSRSAGVGGAAWTPYSHRLPRPPTQLPALRQCGEPLGGGAGDGSGRGSSQGRPRDSGPDPPRPQSLGQGPPHTGPQPLWTPRAGPALLRTDGPHPPFLLSNKKHSFVPKVGPEVSQSPVSCQA